MKKQQKWSPASMKRKNKSTMDMITSQEQIMASQTSNWTVTTGNRTKLKTATTIRDQDDYQDVIAQELDSLFITPEQEESIRRVLELARKSKINSSNAFQLPLKVISPQASENASMRFWKFASELLSTSMNIYDKRVENVFLTSNSMATKLTRAQRNQQQVSDDSQPSKSRIKRKLQLLIDIDAIGDEEAFFIHQLKHLHTEHPSKISLKENKRFFLSDIVFQKQMQVFDSNSLSALFLNSFELGFNLQISFFNDCQEEISPSQNSSLSLSIHQGDQAMIDNLIGKDMKKLSFICSNKNLFDEVRSIRSQYLRNTEVFDEQYTENYPSIYQNFLHEIGQENVGSHFFNEHKTISNVSSPQLDSFQNDFFYSEQQVKQKSNFYLKSSDEYSYLSNQLPFSEQSRDKNIFLNHRDCQTMMTPWELEFKGLKLQRKKEKATRQKTQKIKPTPNSIQFDHNFEELSRQQILLAKAQSQLLKSKIQIIRDKHLTPKTIDPFLGIINKRRSIHFDSNNPEHPQIYNPISSFEEIQIKMQRPFENPHLNIKEEVHETTFIPTDHNTDPNIFEIQPSSLEFNQNNLSSQCVRNIKTFGLSNIRQIKSALFEELIKKKSIKMSQLSLPLSPAGMLIIFLHLANQKNVTLVSLEDQSDLQIML